MPLTTSIDLRLSQPSSDPSAKVINQIILHARASGIDQSTLARRAGISQEALSRLKKAGRCRLSTALALAESAGLTHLTLREEQTVRSAAVIAARKLSAGRRKAIEAIHLVRCLAGQAVSAQYRPHILGFFEELPLELVHDVILDEALNFAGLASLASSLGAEGETVDWLQEMANYSLA